jgi:UDP-glucose 6-dehydrogenase
MLDNGWINPMHTTVPGHDNNISFGGACFPKDISALNEYFKKLEMPNDVINSVIIERNNMRSD